MSLKPEVLDAMVAAGCTGEQIAAAVKASMGSRTTNAERQKRYRERHRDESNVTERNGDACSVTPPSPSLPPQTPPSRPHPPVSNTPARKGPSEAEIRSEFDLFWSFFPRKVGKGQAEKAFATARKESEFDAIMTGVQRYADERKFQDPNFTRHPATWLNGKGWLDEPAPPPALRVVHGQSAAKPTKRAGDRMFDRLMDVASGNADSPAQEGTIDGYAYRR